MGQVMAAQTQGSFVRGQQGTAATVQRPPRGHSGVVHAAERCVELRRLFPQDAQPFLHAEAGGVRGVKQRNLIKWEKKLGNETGKRG